MPYMEVCISAYLLKFLSHLFGGGVGGGYLARRVSWCPLPTRDHKTCVSLNQSLHQPTTLLYAALHCHAYYCTAWILTIEQLVILCQAALHFQVHRERILMELLDERESREWWVADMWLPEPPPHMTTFARLSPISNSHPFDFLTPPPHTMSQ